MAGSDIGQWLVSRGWARADGDRYVEDEKAAREDKRGLWAEARPRLDVTPVSFGSSLGASPGSLVDVPADAAVVVDVSLSTQTLTLTHDGALVGSWPVSTGRRGMATPTGTWRAKWLDRHHRSRQYDDAPMPFSVFFTGGYAVHGTYAVSRLGRPVSHGCIRLSPDHARTLFELAQQAGLDRTVVVVRD